MPEPASPTSASGSSATTSSPSSSGSPPMSCPPSAADAEAKEVHMTVRFDPAAPYDVAQEDMVFAKPAGAELSARIYRPQGAAAAPLAVLVDVHGGAWARGDRTVGAHHGRALAASGLVIAAIDFRQ